MPQESIAEYLSHGQIPFFRLPRADRGNPSPYAGAAAVLLGVPYDAGATYHPGARFGPYELRRVSGFSNHNTNMDSATRVFLDGGNIAVPPLHPGMMRELVQAEIENVLSANAVPFVVGGDHSITLPVLRAVAAKHGPLAVIHVDAHADTNDTGAEAGDEFHHGTPFRHALQEGLIAPGQLHQIGLRYPGDARVMEAFQTREYGMEQVEEKGIRAIMSEVRAAAGERPVYVSIDIDAVDPAFAPGTGTAEPGGLTSREVLMLVRHCKGVRLVGLDLMEVLPAKDLSDLTCMLGAQLLLEGLALIP